MSFENPECFILLVALIPLWWRYVRRRQQAALRFSSVRGIKALPALWHLQLRHLPIVLQTATIVCLVTAMARPQFGRSELKRLTDGLDIVMALDTSGSMRALDFEIDGDTTNRLMAVKHVIKAFIRERSEDRIGLVVFGNEAFTQAPLTLDHDVLVKFIDPLRIGVAGDSTAIGDAIATATNRLKSIESKSKVLILLTDGRNTAGTIEPLVAAKAAAALGVRVYTIGVGRSGEVPIPVDSVFGRRLHYQKLDLDEDLLREIADVSGAHYFRAYDTASLTKVYATIDELEKTKIEVKEYREYDEAYAVFLWPGLLLILARVLFSLTRWQRIP